MSYLNEKSSLAPFPAEKKQESTGGDGEQRMGEGEEGMARKKKSGASEVGRTGLTGTTLGHAAALQTRLTTGPVAAGGVCRSPGYCQGFYCFWSFL